MTDSIWQTKFFVEQNNLLAVYRKRMLLQMARVSGDGTKLRRSLHTTNPGVVSGSTLPPMPLTKLLAR